MKDDSITPEDVKTPKPLPTPQPATKMEEMRALNAELELARSKDAIRNLEAQVDAMAIQIIRIQEERDDAQRAGTPYFKKIHEMNLLVIQLATAQAEIRRKDEALEFYADSRSWWPIALPGNRKTEVWITDKVKQDAGGIARAALADGKEV